MKYSYLLLSLVVAVSAHAGHTHDHESAHGNHTHEHEHELESSSLRAIVHLDGNGIKGELIFTQGEDNLVVIKGTVRGMPAGKYALNIYENGHIGNDCQSLGEHFNPDNNDHGHHHDENRHAGDIDNIIFDENKTSNVKITDHLISLREESRYNVVGRGIAVHERADDHGRTEHPDSKRTGNAGKPLSCGVIGRLAH